MRAWQLARLQLGGSDASLWARDGGLPLGQRGARARAGARRQPGRCAAARQQHRQPVAGARCEAIADDEHPALALVRVRVGALPLVARLTRRSAHALALQPGRPVWAQVKTVALLP